MFDELKKYKKNGHFFFSEGNTLSEVSKAVPELPGIYYILQLAKGRIELVYIGRSEILNQGGVCKIRSLKDVLNNKSQGFFSQKIEEESIDALDIYWFVTLDKTHNDLPGYVQGLLMQRYFEMYGQLPLWNKSF
ncbi:MAG: hypothetical protein ACTHOB_13110 [Ginsengibacter sp.]|jgi:hypothetical protein